MLTVWQAERSAERRTLGSMWSPCSRNTMMGYEGCSECIVGKPDLTGLGVLSAIVLAIANRLHALPNREQL